MTLILKTRLGAGSAEMLKNWHAGVIAAGFGLGGLALGLTFATSSPWPQMILNESGHALYQVGSEADLRTVVNAVRKATGLVPFMDIRSGPTHQIVLSDGITVFATNSDPQAGTSNVRMFVVADEKKRIEAANRLRAHLIENGHTDVWLYEPDPKLPPHTMIIVRSPSTFPGDGGAGFRPDGRTMNALAAGETKFY